MSFYYYLERRVIMKNYEIRRLIESEVQSRGRVDTRLLIAQLANRLKIPKQKKYAETSDA